MIRNIESKDKNGWYTLDHILMKTNFMGGYIYAPN